MSGAYVAAVTVFQVAWPSLLLAPFGLGSAGPAAVDSAVDTSRVLWLYAVSFMFSMIGSAVLECLGLARFGFIVRIVLVWCLCIPIIVAVVLTNRDDPGQLPAIWVIFSFFEAVTAAVCLRRVHRAVRAGEPPGHRCDPAVRLARPGKVSSCMC